MLPPSRIVIVAIILAVPVALANCGRIAFGVANVPSYLGSYEVRAGIPYGTAARQSLDAYMPAPGPANRPIVVFWYGGMWIRGPKEQYRFVGAALANAVGYPHRMPSSCALPFCTPSFTSPTSPPTGNPYRS